MYLDLISNASLLVALTTLYNLLGRVRKHGRPWIKFLLGLLFGGVAAAGMAMPFHYAPGVIYDGRSIVLAMAGLFGGGTAALVSILVAGAYRAFLGGNGVWAGLATIISSAVVGLVFRRACGNRPGKLGIPMLYAVGIVVHMTMLACQMLVMPWPAGFTVIGKVWLPIMLIFPAATVLMGVLLRGNDRRTEAEMALRESEQRYRGLFENSPISIWEEDFSEVKRQIEILKQQGITDFRAFFASNPGRVVEWVKKVKVIDVNKATLTMMHAGNKAQLTGNLDQIMQVDSGADFVSEFVSIAEGKTEFEWDGINHTLDGDLIMVSLRWSVAPGYEDSLEKVLVSLIDITQRKVDEQKLKEYSEHLEEMVDGRTRELREAQEQLVQKERLVVLGRLAGGVSHELRNPLGVILNAVYYLRLIQQDASEKIQQYYGMIEQEAHTAEKIIADLLDFANIKIPDRKALTVSELVQRVLDRFQVPESVTVTLKLPASLPPIYADARQVEQVLGNLVVNACQAMPKGGKLVISAKRQKGMVAVAVADTGTGITPENMKKLFEPLFTTKAKGIGLGLAVSRKLVEANGGRLEVQSASSPQGEPGTGSVFTVYLPQQKETEVA